MGDPIRLARMVKLMESYNNRSRKPPHFFGSAACGGRTEKMSEWW